MDFDVHLGGSSFEGPLEIGGLGGQMQGEKLKFIFAGTDGGMPLFRVVSKEPLHIGGFSKRRASHLGSAPEVATDSISVHAHELVISHVPRFFESSYGLRERSGEREGPMGEGRIRRFLWAAMPGGDEGGLVWDALLQGSPV